MLKTTFGHLAKCANVSFSLQGAVNGGFRSSKLPNVDKKTGAYAPVGD
jgi:hypothetical protein